MRPLLDWSLAHAPTCLEPDSSNGYGTQIALNERWQATADDANVVVPTKDESDV